MSSQGTIPSTPSSANTNNQSVNSANSGRVPKPSPFKRGLKFGGSSASKRTKKVPTIHIVHIKPHVDDNDDTAGEHGFLLWSPDFTEKMMTAPLYQRTNAVYDEFRDELEPIGRVFMMVNEDGTKFKNPRGFQCQAIGFLIPNDMVADTTEETLREFVTDSVIPQIIKFPDMDPDRHPVMAPPPEGYRVVTTWSEVIQSADIHPFITIELRGQTFQNASEYMRASKNNLYSFYKPGTITNTIRQTYQLTVAHMKHEDAINLGLAHVLPRNINVTATENREASDSDSEVGEINLDGSEHDE